MSKSNKKREIKRFVFYLYATSLLKIEIPENLLDIMFL